MSCSTTLLLFFFSVKALIKTAHRVKALVKTVLRLLIKMREGMMKTSTCVFHVTVLISVKISTCVSHVTVLRGF
jgi:hypothetical protein